MTLPGAPEPKPLSLRVLIVEDDTIVGVGLKSQLEALGHVSVGRAAALNMGRAPAFGFSGSPG